MNRIIIAIILCSFWALNLNAQGSIDLKYEIREVNCESSKVTVDMFVRKSAPVDFRLGSLSLRMTFNEMAITNPAITEASPDGGMYEISWQEDVFSYGILVFEEVNAPELRTEWLRIGTVVFDVVSWDQPVDLRWKRGDEYPATTAQEFISFLEQPNLKIGDVTDLNEYLSWYCEFSTGVETDGPISDETGLHIYPNPSDGNIFLEFLTTPSSSGEYEVTSMEGKRILNGQVDARSEGVVIPIDLTHVSSGSYVIVVTDGDKKISKKLEIIQD